MGKKKSVYAVAVGRRPGIYTSWGECRKQVEGYTGNAYAGFASTEEAKRYLSDRGISLKPAAAGGEQPAAPASRRAPPAADADHPSPSAAAKPPPRKRKAPEAASTKQRPSAPAAARHEARPAATERRLRLEFDGASKSNPGPSGWGAVLYDEATGVEVSRMCQYMGDHHTNNQAEYAGLIGGLQAALELGCRSISVQGDSTLIIRQVLGNWRVKNEGLRPYHAAATALMHRFSSFKARQVMREFNQVADALSNQAIADYRSGANLQLWRIEDAAAMLDALDGEEEEEGWDEEGRGGNDAAAAAALNTEAAETAATEIAAAETEVEAAAGGSSKLGAKGKRPAKRAKQG